LWDYLLSSSRRLRNANAATLIMTPTIISATGAESPVRGAEPTLEVEAGALLGAVATVVVVVVGLFVVVSALSVVLVSDVEVVSVVVLVRSSFSPV